jgi:hypothetical protein
MIPRHIAGATHALGAPADWDKTRDGNCCVLHVRAVRDGRNTRFESAWEPTPEELALLNAGGSVILSVVGGQPPVWLEVKSAEGEAA